MKCCIACKHFTFDCGDRGYSSMTPGTSASMECAKGHFRKESWSWRSGDPLPDLDNGLLPTEGLLTKGLNCPDFELSDLARSKGWRTEGDT